MRLAIILKNIEGVPETFQVLPYGEIRIEDDQPAYVDEEAMRSIIAEFARRGNDMVIDYEHQTLKDVQAPAAGWIKQLVDKGKDGLFAAVEWMEKAKEYLKNKEYRYFSPVMFVSKKGRKVVSIANVALTNSPKINNLKPIMAKMSHEDPEREEDGMLQKLKKLFGLADDAGEDKVLQAAEAVVAKAKEIGARLAALVACKEVLEAVGATETDDKTQVVAKIVALRTAGDKRTGVEAELVALKKDHDDLKKKWNERNAEELIAKALGKGQITPAQVNDWGRQMAIGQPETFTKLVLSRREFSEIPLQDLPAGDKDTPSGSAAGKLDKLVAKKIVDEKLGYGDAFLAVQKEHPDLAREVASELAASRRR